MVDPEAEVGLFSPTRAGSSVKARPSVVEREKPPMTHVVGRTGLFRVKSTRPRGLGVERQRDDGRVVTYTYIDVYLVDFLLILSYNNNK